MRIIIGRFLLNYFIKHLNLHIINYKYVSQIIKKLYFGKFKSNNIVILKNYTCFFNMYNFLDFLYIFIENI